MGAYSQKDSASPNALKTLPAQQQEMGDEELYEAHGTYRSMTTTNKILPVRFLNHLLLALALIVLNSCGGHSDPSNAIDPPTPSSRSSITEPDYSISVSGFSDVQFIPADSSQTDLALTTNMAGATVKVRFSCESCDLQISSSRSEKIAAANQDIPVTFATLDSSSDVTLEVKDIDKGTQQTFRLLALPADAITYRYQAHGEQEPGDFYVTPAQFAAGTSDVPSYAYIIGNNGALKYYRRTPAKETMLDFKKSTLKDGSIRYSFHDSAVSGIRILDEKFNPRQVITAIPLAGSDSQSVELHDHILISDSHYVIGTLENRTVTNVPSRSGMPTKVMAFGLEEINNGVLEFSWLSSDHPELYACSTDGNAYNADSYADYIHFNSVMIDADGNFIVSARHLDAVMKINRKNGSIAWILGGPCDQFGLKGSQLFSHQHYARRTPDGRLSIFDNSNTYGNTRVAAFRLDEQSKTVESSDPATPAFAAYDPASSLLGLPKPESVAMGSAQIFSSGRILAGWGFLTGRPNVPDFTEFDSTTGMPDFELAFQPAGNVTFINYRAQKFR